jgi:hypothetical protein
LEALAVAARDPELAAATGARPPQAVDEIDGFAVIKRSGSARPMTCALTRWRLEHDRVADGKWHVHAAFRLNTGEGIVYAFISAHCNNGAGMVGAIGDSTCHVFVGSESFDSSAALVAFRLHGGDDSICERW